MVEQQTKVPSPTQIWSSN